MTEAEWLKCADPDAMIERYGGASRARKLRLFLCACCREVWDFLCSEASRRGVEVAEAFADGLTNADELEHACRLIVASMDLYGDEPIYDPAYWACRTTIAEGYPRCLVYAQRRNTVPIRDEGVDYPNGFDDYQRRCHELEAAQTRVQASLVREIFGNPFRPVSFDPAWRTNTALTLARQMYESREFGAAPILADALQDAGCDADELLNHLRDTSAVHVRGCWALDLLLGKE
jgi:hypothetical protein